MDGFRRILRFVRYNSADHIPVSALQRGKLKFVTR